MGSARVVPGRAPAIGRALAWAITPCATRRTRVALGGPKIIVRCSSSRLDQKIGDAAVADATTLPSVT